VGVLSIRKGCLKDCCQLISQRIIRKIISVPDRGLSQISSVHKWTLFVGNGHLFLRKQCGRLYYQYFQGHFVWRLECFLRPVFRSNNEGSEMQALLQDLRFSLRQIRRTPGFMITAVLTLALGVGANTAIYSLLDQALLRSLPVRDPERLVILSATGKAWDGHISNNGAGVEKSFSYPMYRDLRDRANMFDGLVATAATSVGIARQNTSSVSQAEIVSGNYFSVLGVTPAMGRLITQSDDSVPNGNPVAVLSFAYWKSRLGADPQVVGETISINGHPFQVIGISASGFQSAVWGETPDIFLPMSMLDQVVPGKGKRLEDHKDRWLNIFGRLKPGESAAQAQTAVAPLWHALRAEELKALGTRSQRFVDEFLTRSQLQILPGARGLSYNRDSLKAPLLAVMGMAILVLLIATVNVASLLLVRSAARVREFALRYALGANTARVVQQLLLEGLLIGLAGGVAGLLIAPAAIRALVKQLGSPDNTSAFQTSLDGRLMVFNFMVALFVSVFFSLAPAIQLFKPDLVSSLKQQVSTATHGALSFRRLIVSLQVGLSVLLLVGSGLFVRTLQNLRRVDTGMNTTSLITFAIDPQLAGYTANKIPQLHQRVLDAMTALPGVQSVGATNDAELADTDHGANVTVEGYTPPPDEDFDVEVPSINPSFFQAMQIPIVAGRPFAEMDDEAHPLVGIANESFARHFFASAQAAVGRRVAYGAGNNLHFMTIVGVAKDNKHANLRDLPLPTLFSPLKQDPAVNQLHIYLRTSTPPAQSFASVREAVKEIDPGLTANSMRTMEDQIDETLSNERMIELLAISFGVLATLLAGVGLYGVLAYSTAQRTREIGIRIALGSTRLKVSLLVLTDVLRLAGIGLAVALPCAFLLARLLRSQLFGVSTTDPLTIVSVVILIAFVALASALIPARRASTVDPMKALRSE
jgi:putative ABC transport system permease protein